jgi:hypothetical protein
MRAEYCFWIACVGVGLFAQNALADLRVLEEGDSSRISIEHGESRSRIRILVETDDDTTESSIEVPIPPVPPRGGDWDWKDHDDSGDLVKVGEDIRIEADQVVEGVVVAIAGDVTIHGHVLDDVVSVGGNIFVEPGAVIEGNTVAIGGRVHRKPGATVLDGDVSVPLAIVPHIGGGWLGPGLRFALVLMMMVFLFLSGGFFDLIMPDRFQKLTVYVQNRIWGSFFAGLAAEILSLPVFLLLCITILGIPIALLLPFAYFGGLLLGFLAVASLVGSRVGVRNLAQRGSRLFTLAIGLAILLGVHLFALLLSSMGGVLSWFGAVLSLFAVAANWTVATIGLGAVLLSRVGTRTGEGDPSLELPSPMPAIPPHPKQV